MFRKKWYFWREIEYSTSNATFGSMIGGAEDISMVEPTAVVESNSVGRPRKAMKHAGAISEAEERISDRLPELADNALESALGRKPEVCRFHHGTLECPKESCNEKSKGGIADPQMVKYLLNRIMGNPGQSIDRQINLEFITKVTSHITDVFHESNQHDDPQERANVFAQGVSQLWALIGLNESDA